MKGSRRTSVLLLIASAMAASTLAHAGTASLNGQPLTVTLLETGAVPPVSVDIITAGPGGPQIVGNTPSDPIGSILFSAESVNAQNLQIVYNIEGGGGAYTGTAPGCTGSSLGCSLWGSTADDARFLFSGLNFGSTGVILESVSLTTNNVFDVQVANVTADSFEVIFGSAGILNGTGGIPALGTITLDLQTGVAAVPLPSSVVMLLGGLLLIVFVNGRGRHLLNSARS
jgi:hypothetical protein